MLSFDYCVTNPKSGSISFIIFHDWLFLMALSRLTAWTTPWNDFKSFKLFFSFCSYICLMTSYAQNMILKYFLEYFWTEASSKAVLLYFVLVLSDYSVMRRRVSLIVTTGIIATPIIRRWMFRSMSNIIRYSYCFKVWHCHHCWCCNIVRLPRITMVNVAMTMAARMGFCIWMRFPVTFGFISDIVHFNMIHCVAMSMGWLGERAHSLHTLTIVTVPVIASIVTNCSKRKWRRNRGTRWCTNRAWNLWWSSYWLTLVGVFHFHKLPLLWKVKQWRWLNYKSNLRHSVVFIHSED